MYLENTWYVAACADEVGREPLGRGPAEDEFGLVHAGTATSDQPAASILATSGQTVSPRSRKRSS